MLDPLVKTATVLKTVKGLVLVVKVLFQVATPMLTTF
jgi:hypothetical protein